MICIDQLSQCPQLKAICKCVSKNETENYFFSVSFPLPPLPLCSFCSLPFLLACFLPCPFPCSTSLLLCYLADGLGPCCLASTALSSLLNFICQLSIIFSLSSSCPRLYYWNVSMLDCHIGYHRNVTTIHAAGWVSYALAHNRAN